MTEACEGFHFFNVVTSISPDAQNFNEFVQYLDSSNVSRRSRSRTYVKHAIEGHGVV
jgi:hypothetical protein